MRDAVVPNGFQSEIWHSNGLSLAYTHPMLTYLMSRLFTPPVRSISLFSLVYRIFLTCLLYTEVGGSNSARASEVDASPSTPIERPPIVLGSGEQRLLRVPGLLKYSLGNNVARILPLSLPRPPRSHPQNSPLTSNLGSQDPKEALLIKGVQPGTGDLWVWNSDGTTEYRTIRVEKRVLGDKNLPLERALGKLDETEVIISGQGIVIRGEIYSLRESSKISSLTQNFPQVIHDETLLSEQLIEEGVTLLSQWLKASRYQETLRIEKSGRSLWLRGQITRPSERSDLERQAKAIFPQVKIDIEHLPDLSPTVHFRVFLLELKKNRFKSEGLAWPKSIQGVFQVTSGAFVDPLQMELALQQLEGNGDARILSNPELVVRAPGEAELFAGGELPITTLSRFYSNISWRNYGLTLKLKVTQSAGDRVRLEIFTEVSHLDTTISQDKVPGIQANRMKTQIDAKYGTPLFLSGLLQQTIREEAKGLPFLRNIPVLGLLFGSKDYLNERSELVAILYPHATPPVPPDESQTHLVPVGTLPFPRNWISPEEERSLRESKDFPWNALN